MKPGYRRLVFFAVLLALMVIVMGAYVRLSDAGLSCPDWPGCYGKMLVPSEEQDVLDANTAFPESPVVISRAWKEMFHRYLAAVLGLVIALLAGLTWRRRCYSVRSIVLANGLLVLVVFQAALGMWTVTHLLKPIIVTAHLLGGMATLALLWWLWLSAMVVRVTPKTTVRVWAFASVVVVFAQIVLGGWTSANYAALACTDFPTCRGAWWPEMEFAEAFSPWRELGQSSFGTPISAAGLTAIQIVHRVGAVITLLVVGGFAGFLLWGSKIGVRLAATSVLVLLAVQIIIGVATVVMARPLSFAVAHNLVAALLLIAVLTLAQKANSVP